MKATFLKGVVLGSAVSFAMLSATAAFAGNGVGSILNLGQSNSVDGSTRLTGSSNASQLAVANTSTAAGATGIGIAVANGKPPLAVNSTTKVAKLNADLLDGADSTAFQKRVSPHCVNGTAITKIGPNGGVDCSTSTVVSLSHFIAANSIVPQDLAPSGVRVFLACHLASGPVGFEIEPITAAGSLNWMFSQGGTTSTVNADGVSLNPNGLEAFDLSGTRLEGQFIWSDPGYAITMNVHVFDAGSGCELTGTAEIAVRS